MLPRSSLATRTTSVGWVLGRVRAQPRPSSARGTERGHVFYQDRSLVRFRHGRASSSWVAGVGGMTAARELAERGFSVKVFEKRDLPGGKARSVEVEGSAVGESKPLPGEPGFRFFPRFYRHLPDMSGRATPLVYRLRSEPFVNGYRLPRRGVFPIANAGLALTRSVRLRPASSPRARRHGGAFVHRRKSRCQRIISRRPALATVQYCLGCSCCSLPASS